MLLQDLMNSQREIWEMMEEERPHIDWMRIPIRLHITDQGNPCYEMHIVVIGKIPHHLTTEKGSTPNELYVNVLHRIQVKRWKPEQSTIQC